MFDPSFGLFGCDPVPEKNDLDQRDKAPVDISIPPLIKAYVDQEVGKAKEAEGRAQTKRWKNSWRSASPITKGSFMLTAAVALATIAYAIIAGFQLSAMKKANGLTEIALSGNDKTLLQTTTKMQLQADAMNRLADKASLQVDKEDAVVKQTKRLAEAAGRSATFAQDSLQATADASYQELRSFVGIQSAVPRHLVRVFNGTLQFEVVFTSATMDVLSLNTSKFCPT